MQTRTSNSFENWIASFVASLARPTRTVTVQPLLKYLRLLFPSTPVLFVTTFLVTTASPLPLQQPDQTNPFEIPVYPSRRRYENDTLLKIERGLENENREHLIDLINADPLVCRSALIRLLRSPETRQQGAELASSFPLGTLSQIEVELVDFLHGASPAVRSTVLDSFEMLGDLEIALRRRGFNDNLSLELHQRAPGIVDAIMADLEAAGFEVGKAYCLYFKGQEVYDFSEEGLPALIREARNLFQKHGLIREEFKCLVREASYFYLTDRKEEAEGIIDQFQELARTSDDTLLQVYAEWKLPAGRPSIIDPWKALSGLPGLTWFKAQNLLWLSEDRKDSLGDLDLLVTGCDDSALAARIYWALARHLSGRNDPRSFEAFQRAFELATPLHYDVTAFDDSSQLPPVPAASFILHELAGALKASLSYREARDVTLDSLRLLEDEVYWTRDQIVALKPVLQGDLAQEYRRVGEYGLALELRHQIAETLEDQGEIHYAKLNCRDMADIYTDLGDYDSAEEVLKRALQIPDRVFNYSSILLGELNLNFARYEEALRWLDTAKWDLEETTRGRYWRLERLRLLVELWLELGDPDRAQEYAEAFSELSGNDWPQSVVLGKVLLRLNRFDEAKQLYEGQLEEALRANRKGIEAEALKGLGRALRLKGEPIQAIPLLERSLQLVRRMGNVQAESELSLELALARVQAGNRTDGRAELNRALRAAESLNDHPAIWTARFKLGRIAESMRDSSLAIEHYRSAIQAVEAVSGHIRVEDNKISFLQDKTEIYDRLIGLLGPTQPNEAFYVAEKRRAQAYLDSIRTRGLAAHRPSERLAQRSREIETRLIGKQSALREQYALPITDRDSTLIARLQDELIELRREHAQILRTVQLHRGVEVYREGLTLPLRVEAVQSRILKPEQALLEYIVTKDTTYALLIDKTACRFHDLAFPGKQLETKVSQLLEPVRLLRSGKTDLLHLDYDVALAHELYRRLLKPLEADFGGIEELVIVPDDVLHFLPFESLARSPRIGPPNRQIRYAEFSDVDWIARRFAISYAISATSLDPDLRAEKRWPPALVAFAEPFDPSEDALEKRAVLRGSLGPLEDLSLLAPLPLAVEEVRTVGRLMEEKVEVTTLTGKEASEDAFFEYGPRAGYLHFAVHSLVDNQVPDYSALVLSPGGNGDGFLQTFEIFKTQLNSRLVTLSGCETALGRLQKGEGLLGLKRAFLLAGARSVLVTLWSIEDNSAEFMAHFYDLIRQDVPVARALHDTKLAYLEKTKPLGKGLELSLSHPFFWAPFTLTETLNGQ